MEAIGLSCRLVSCSFAGKNASQEDGCGFIE